MISYSKEEAKQKMNELGKAETPFLFILDFELQKPVVIPLHAVDNQEIRYSMDDHFLEYRNFFSKPSEEPELLKLEKSPLTFETFEKAFSIVHDNLQRGNSFLTNLTAETPIEVNWSLESVFQHCAAKYKLFVKDNFMCFSPETFVQVNETGKISSFPMKGTIDAQIPNAASAILADKKEKYEHTTIVDLIRNDLSKIAEKVWVERFRYIDKIKKADGKELLQVSSEVCGQLPENWKCCIGQLIFDLLPAGSISGAPKPKTVEIIQEAEKLTYESGQRGYYTGVFGVFDGSKLNSAVMIRYIEQRGKSLFFKSGGGITWRSDPQKEYDELISKIYVPVL
ncbi:aminodeoxychorismate synthase component I [Jiulongibacter sediminis]|uniref:aminodeoxychorismate synthase component I n=1 Tax=Jiulongibacter sediminis TaxID=1605367 RepID=UPI0026EE9872|nr:aminodeoxychorismate synthase component I [Jiulongibacter sediminis]